MTLGTAPPRKRPPLYCSFCGKMDAEVGYLVAGPTVFICNECVEACREIGQTMLVENAVKQTNPGHGELSGETKEGQ